MIGKIIGSLGAGLLLVTGIGCEEETRTLLSRDIYVVDGDTIKHDGETYRLLGYDTPETYRAKCDSEKRLGDLATHRLRELVQTHGSAEITRYSDRDRYGRLLVRLYIGGKDVGPILINQGLARYYDGGKRRGWC